MKETRTSKQSLFAYVKVSLAIILSCILSGNVLAATYYSTAGGSQNLTTLAFWKTARNGTGTSPSNFTAGDIFVVQGSGNGGTTPHLITSTTALSISGTNSKLQIENGASLQSNAAITLAAATTFQVDNGGTYNHNNTGTPSSTIFQGTESFGASSTVNILQWINNTTVITTGVTLPFGNLTINNSTFSSAWNQSWSGAINLCAGNFTITTTGGGQFRFTGTGTTTVTVAGNYSQAADAVSFGNGNGANVTFNVGGNFSLSGAGNFLLTDGNSSIGNTNVTGTTNITTTGTNGIKLVNSGNGSTTGTFQTTDVNATGTSSRMVDFGANGTSAFNIDGNFSKSGTGTFYTTSSSIVGSFVFNKAGTQTFSYAGATTQYTNYIITSGSTLQMLTGLTLGTATIPISSVTVNSGGTLDMGTQVITGANNTDPQFTLASGAKIITANATGVQGSITNIGATDLSLNSGANYEFQGAATGTFTTTTTNTVNNLIVNRSAGVSLSMAFTVNGNLDFQNGILTTGGNSLTVAAAGNIINFSSSKYVDGKLNRVFSAAGTKTFPVGKSGVYRAVNFNYTALTGTSTVSVEQFESAVTGTLPAGTNLNNSRYWDISQTGGSSLSYKVTLDATGDNITGTVVMLKKESSAITSNAATAASPNYTNTTAYSGITGTVSHTTGSTCTVSSNAGSDQAGAATCGLTQVTMAGNTPSFGTGAWSVVTGTGGSFVTPSSPASLFNGTAGNSYNLRWLITNGNCTANSTMNVTFNLNPAANSGNNNSTTICGNSSYTVANASTTNAASFSWSSSSGNSAGFSSTTALNPTYTPNATDIANGSVTITLTAVNNPCTNATSSKTLTIIAAPTANSGTAISTCSNSGAVNITAGSTASNNTGVTWSTPNGTGNFANANSLTTATYTPSAADITAGNVTLTLTASGNSPCADATSNKTLTIVAEPSASSGTPVSACSNSGAVNITAGSTASNNSGVTWSTPDGTGSFANANSLTTATYTPSAADITAGSVTLTLTANGNSPCGNATSNKTLTITAEPTANSGTAISTCSNSGAVNITAGSSASNNTGVTWSTPDGTGSFTNANSLTTATYTPSAADITAGSVTLTLTASGNSPCADATSNKTLTIVAEPSASSGTPVSTCSNSGAVNITSGSTASDNSGVTWSTPDGTGSFANANSLTTATYTPSAADITAGSVTLTLTASPNSPCANDATSNKTLTITAEPTASAGTAISTCSNSGAVNITAGSTVSNNTGVTWSTPDGTGSFANPNSLTTATYTPSAADITAGSVTLTLTAGGNSPCADATSNKTLTIVAEPLAAAGSDDAVCFGNDFITSATASGYAGLSWATSGTGTFTNGNTLNATYSPSSADSMAGSVVLTLTASGNSPCADATDNMTLTINAAPTNATVSSISGATEACSGQVTLMTANITGGSGLTYSWNKTTNPSVVLFSNSAGGPFSPGPFQTAGNTVYAQFGSVVGSGYNVCAQVSNTCGTAANKCDWIRGKVGTPGTIIGSTVACAGNVKTYSCGASGGATVYTWTLAGSTIPVTGGQGNNTNVQVTYPVAFTSGQLCVTASLVCGGSSTSVARCVTVSNTPVVPGAFTSAPSRVCPGQTNVLFSVPASNFASGYNWTVPVGASIVETPPYSTSIHVNFPNPYTGAPPVCVYATSSCASSPGRCKTVGSNKPGQPGSMNGPVNNVCNSTVQYSVSFDPLATSYTWTLPTGATSIIQNGPAIQFTMPGNFSNGFVSVVANTSLCTPGNSQARSINVSGAPPMPVAITINPPGWCSGQTINASVPVISPVPNYVWSVSNGTIDAGQGTNNIDVNTANQGAVVIQVRAGNSCGLSNNKVLHSSPSCREEGEELALISNQLSVYPNPAHDKLTVSINAKEESHLTILLTDITGRVVLSENKPATQGLNSFELTLNHLPKGVYMLEVKAASESWKSKVVVE